jgi:hypothetical protein
MHSWSTHYASVGIRRNPGQPVIERGFWSAWLVIWLFCQTDEEMRALLPHRLDPAVLGLTITLLQQFLNSFTDLIARWRLTHFQGVTMRSSAIDLRPFSATKIIHKKTALRFHHKI